MHNPLELTSKLDGGCAREVSARWGCCHTCADLKCVHVQLGQGAVMHGCRQCDFDLCEEPTLRLCTEAILCGIECRLHQVCFSGEQQRWAERYAEPEWLTEEEMQAHHSVPSAIVHDQG